MSAQPTGTYTQPRWRPDPARQKRADYTLDDLLNLPPDLPRVELSHGVMLVVPSPTARHQNIGRRLCNSLEEHAPDGLWPAQAVGLLVTTNHTLEPDVMLLRAEALERDHYFSGDEAVLVVEIVSPGTRIRDRIKKPTEYAAAGVPYYWRVEQNPLHVYAFRLTANGSYELAADSADVLELDEPFPIRLAVPDLATRKPPSPRTTPDEVVDARP